MRKNQQRIKEEVEIKSVVYQKSNEQNVSETKRMLAVANAGDIQMKKMQA